MIIANGEVAQPFTIRFTGLLDNAATGLVEYPGNSTGATSCLTDDLSIPDSVQYVAHATALNRHRSLFPSSRIGEDVDNSAHGHIPAFSTRNYSATVADGVLDSRPGAG